ncbi:MAG TPA: multicopper oxidase family protein [Rhizomicrobium sp.]|nr:multicopper oxidase family protein [Rhizomicrobium sp.]
MSGVISRRQTVASLSAVAALSLARCGRLIAGAGGAGRLPELRIGNREITLVAHEVSTAILPDGPPSPTWLFGAHLFPVLRMRRGERATVTLRNALPQHTSIHWHGVRVPNAMDGVPYLTQRPVLPGERFTYRFEPPDAGTFFFHPHCNTAEQLGRGLIGMLIVDDDAPTFDDDLVLVLKDWRLARDGIFNSFVTLAGASRAGTFGNLRTVNGHPSPRIEIPGGANIRMRLVNADSTRILSVGLGGTSASVIAIDGNPVAPFALDTWRLGPAMRLDLALRSPRDGEIRLIDYFDETPVTLASLAPRGAPARNDVFTARPLPANSLRAPDMAAAWTHTLELGAGVVPLDIPDPPPIVLPDGSRVNIADALCLASATFWMLDGKSWPLREHGRLPPPLFSFDRGQSVVLEFRNATKRAHPIHIHGHTMRVLSASILPRPVHHADTVLVMPNERVKVAFVADNPGNWMIHCHIIEHQETGMMGWFRVS